MLSTPLPQGHGETRSLPIQRQRSLVETTDMSGKVAKLTVLGAIWRFGLKPVLGCCRGCIKSRPIDAEAR